MNTTNTTFIKKTHLQPMAMGLMFIALMALMLFFSGNAHADLFAGGKEQIKAATNSDSTLYLAMMVIGLAAAAVTGFVTKNWFAAIGGFAAGVIFVNVAMGIIGLT